MGSFDDRVLWEAFKHAREVGDDDEARRVRSEIVEFHKGFVISYARKTANFSWPVGTLDDYLHDLLEIVTNKVEDYDPERGVSFVGMVKPWLRNTRNDVSSRLRTIKESTDTYRIRMIIERRLTDDQIAGRRSTSEELAEHVFKIYGRAIGPERVNKILATRTIIWADDNFSQRGFGEDGNSNHWDLLPDKVNVEETVLGQMEQDETTERVRDALAAIELTELEYAIVSEILMSDSQVTLAELGERFGISAGRVSVTKRELTARLRDLLG